MSQKQCKKCKRSLPDGYKYKYCENCRNERAKQVRNIGKTALGVAVMVGGTTVTILSKGKINPNKK